MPFAVGTQASAFSLPDQYGKTFSLASARGKANILLIFLPAAFTPLCTSTVPLLDSMLPQFFAANTLPVVITTDGRHSNLAWSRQCGASKLRLLSDFWPHAAVSRAYGVMAQDGMAERSTVLIDSLGRVRFSQIVGRDNKHDLHALLNIARAVNGNQPLPAGNSVGVLPQVDIPQLYLMHGCPACERVDTYLAHSGMSPYVTERWIDTDPAAAAELTMAGGNGTPTMRMPDGRLVEGDGPIIAALSRRT